MHDRVRFLESVALGKPTSTGVQSSKYIAHWYGDMAEAVSPSMEKRIVALHDIEFSSLCKHHHLPFFGKVDIVYLPNKKIVRPDKAVRLVELFARRLQLQEHLTRDIAEFIDELIHPQGVWVSVRGQHLCSLQNIQDEKPDMVTQVLLGKLPEYSLPQGRMPEPGWITAPVTLSAGG